MTVIPLKYHICHTGGKLIQKSCYVWFWSNVVCVRLYIDYTYSGQTFLPQFIWKRSIQFCRPGLPGMTCCSSCGKSSEMLWVRLREESISKSVTLWFGCEFWDTLPYKRPDLKVAIKVLLGKVILGLELKKKWSKSIIYMKITNTTQPSFLPAQKHSIHQCRLKQVIVYQCILRFSPIKGIF